VIGQTAVLNGASTPLPSRWLWRIRRKKIPTVFRALAVHCRPLAAKIEPQAAAEIAKGLAAAHCFHCKNELFTVMEAAKAELGYRHIAYGMNVDDRHDFRPGHTAARQHGVLAPLAEVGLTKADIRTLARRAGLSVWDKPVSACLSSRIAYGRPVNRETLARVEQAEEYLRNLGFRQFRVRDHGDLARIEVAKDEMEAILVPARMKNISKALKATGFTYVAIDCEGYRSGSMNAVLGEEQVKSTEPG
jgi:uncharacterized protein